MQQVEFNRILTMDLPKGQSAFLLGARKTGKSYYLAKHFARSIRYDLLNSNQYIRLLKEPDLLREEVSSLTEQQLASPVIIDEIQKIPLLLNEVHWLIENTSASFILCGSSARKLKSSGVNLLGGRAWNYFFFPLVYPEIPDFDLLRALNQGLIPSHYMANNWEKTIKAYVSNYLVEEIKAEGLVRNLYGFSRFLDAAVFSNGELVNYANIAQDCGIDSKTVKEYFQILVDTLLGYYIEPYRNKKKRSNLVLTPKFYFFDVGVVSHLKKRQIMQIKGEEAGNAFEHYILMELMAYRGLKDLDFEIHYWRTHAGYEVDFVLDNARIAIEVKVKSTPRLSDLKGLAAFQKEYHPKRAIVVCHAPRKRKITTEENEIEIFPWEAFLQELWGDKLL